MAMTTDEIQEQSAALVQMMTDGGIKHTFAVVTYYTSAQQWSVFGASRDRNGPAQHHYDANLTKAFADARAWVRHEVDRIKHLAEPTQDDYGDMNDRAEKLAEKWESEQ